MVSAFISDVSIALCEKAMQLQAKNKLICLISRASEGLFETTVWEKLCDPNGEDADSLTHYITDYVNFCVENTLTPKMVPCFSNNKLWKIPHKNRLY